MDEMVAFCGLNCRTCPIYLASNETDEAKKNDLKTSVMYECKEYYGIDYSIQDINDCDGCRSLTGRIFSGCSKCPVRECAIERGIENCVFCEEYTCKKLNELFKVAPEAKKCLDIIHKSLGLSWNLINNYEHRLYIINYSSPNAIRELKAVYAADIYLW